MIMCIFTSFNFASKVEGITVITIFYDLGYNILILFHISIAIKWKPLLKST